jgi:hypothetical protein
VSEGRDIPCIHLGTATTSHPCNCAGGRGRTTTLHGCGIHKECGPDPAAPPRGKKWCRTCSDYQSAIREIVPGVIDPLQDPELQGRPKSWVASAEVQAVRIAALRQLASMNITAPHRTGGYGVITCGGGIYWPGIVVAVKILRTTGSTLPVEVWHRRDEAVDSSQLDGIPNVAVRCLEDHIEKLPPGQRPRIYGPGRGWETKTLAMVYSDFRRVLFIDADAYCVEDPAPMFAHLDSAPFAYWSDLDSTENNVKGPAHGIESEALRQKGVRGEAGWVIPPVQGGQLLIDLEAGWRFFVVTHWMNQHSDYFYSHQFGDQDSWRAALAVTGTPYVHFGRAHWDRIAFVCHSPEDRKPYVVHRCRAKLSITSKTPTNHKLPKEAEVMATLESVRVVESMEAAFTRVYTSGTWGANASSGAGSRGAELSKYVDILSTLLTMCGAIRVDDIGSGDGAVIAAMVMRMKSVEFVGYEVYGPATERGIPGATVVKADVTADGWVDTLGKFDGVRVCTVKDVFHHWPTASIETFLSTLLNAKLWDWVIVTNDRTQGTNTDCPLGGYRGLDPTMKPLSAFADKVAGRIDYNHKAVVIYRGGRA